MEPCTPCAYAAEHGWWGDTLPHNTAAHCRSCHVSFPGANKWGHCTKCHQTFRGVSAFDRHQMLSNCPTISGAVSEVAATVCDALYETAAAQIADGKRHYLVENEHPWGFQFWHWYQADEVKHHA